MENISRRSRLDSLHGLLEDHRDYKRMKTDDSRWAKIDKRISQPSTQLILFEVPKGVIITQNNENNLV